ncbi:MAG: peptidylprolyl isomerase [Pirellulaceae bacterium]|nr:peptidylprolyl isomerase [Pirellulaceae bacterium]
MLRYGLAIAGWLVGSAALPVVAQQKKPLSAVRAAVTPASTAQTQNTQPAAGQAASANVPVGLDKIPKVVAVVNGHTIARDKIADACIQRFGTIVLDNLLNKHLILQACEAKNIKITQADVNAEIDRVASKFGLTTKLFLQSIDEQRDVTPEQYASEIVWPMLALRALAADKIAVTPQEIEQVIQSEYGPKVSVRMIAVSEVDKAKQLHQQAMSQPELFRRLAKEHSEDAPSASVDGLLPPIRQHSGDDLLERMAFQLKEGEISPVFQVGNLHILLQCVRHLPATPPDPQLLPAIQERIVDHLRDERLAKAADELFAKLQQNSQVVAVIGNPQLEQQYPAVAGFINNQPVSRDHLALECINRHGRQVLRGEINRLLITEALKQANLTIEETDIQAELSAAAEGMGYFNSDGTPNTDAWVKAVMEDENVPYQLYVQDAVWPKAALRKLAEREVQITDDDLRKGFEANFGPRAEVLAIVLSNQRTAEQVFRQIRQSPTEQNFGELAAKYSVEPVSRSNFGKIQPIRQHGGMPTLEKEAFALEPGTHSGVIALSNDQYCILYKQGDSQPIVQDFEAVKPEIARELHEKKLNVAMQHKIDQLLKSSQIENFLEGSIQIGATKSADRPSLPAKTASFPITR